MRMFLYKTFVNMNILGEYLNVFTNVVIDKYIHYYAIDIDLSYKTLTSASTQEKLHLLKETYPKFWKELTKNSNSPTPTAETQTFPEDIVDPDNYSLDYIEVPVDFLIGNIVSSQLATGDGPKFDGMAEQNDADDHQGLEADVEQGGQTAGPSKTGQGG